MMGIAIPSPFFIERRKAMIISECTSHQRVKTKQQIYRKFIKQGKDEYVVVSGGKYGYGHKVITGHLKEGHPEISEYELAVFLDDGNLFFGGKCVIREDGTFFCKVYTD